MNEELDGMIHLSDLSWDKSGEEAMTSFVKGQKIKVKVLDVDFEKERINLGIKQLENDPLKPSAISFRKGKLLPVLLNKY